MRCRIFEKTFSGNLLDSNENEGVEAQNSFEKLRFCSIILVKNKVIIESTIVLLSGVYFIVYSSGLKYCNSINQNSKPSILQTVTNTKNSLTQVFKVFKVLRPMLRKLEIANFAK